MPLPINIDALVHGRSVEWERLEFKQGWDPLDTLHTICAFANDFHNLGGGYVIVGVAERNGQPVLPPVGLDPGALDAIQKEILELGHSAIRPSYHPIVVPHELHGRAILVIWVPGGQTRPYKARKTLARDGGDWTYYIRKGSCTVVAKGPDEAELLTLAATVPFDDRINQQARVADLSRDLMLEFLREVGSELANEAEGLPLDELGRRMNVIGGPAEASFPLNVGLLFFHPEPQRYFPATQIDVVWFPEGPGGDRFTEKSFRGPIQRMVREALDYIRRNFISETVTKHPDRAEATRTENFPYAAVEEAVVNAIYHRSYEEREPVEVRITPQELLVLSFPGPDRSIRMDQLRAGRAVSRRYRNRRIGEFLKELDLTEGRATGIPKILRAMKENGSPAPEFETDEGRSSFLVRIPARSPVARGEGREPGAVRDTPHGAPHVTPHVTPHVEAAILAYCQSPRSLAEILGHLGLKDRKHLLNKYLHPMLAAGWIARAVPDKPRSRLQRYWTTGAGARELARRGGS